MMLQMNHGRRETWVKYGRALLVAALLIFLSTPGISLAATAEQKTFATPEEAVKALVEALKRNDVKELEAIFGPEGEDLISSGDPVDDQSVRERFVKEFEEKNRLEKTADKAVLSIGKEDWPFPVPIIKVDSLWLFDAEEGREEILARRIGRNELSVIQVCLAVVDAQREYALKDRNGNGVREYAQKFRSDPGKKDGLYWEAKEGDEQSPLGPLFAEAHKEGYQGAASGGEPIPYHGYYYRILKAQGKDAPGGPYEYVVRGKMIGGFALLAYPAEYGASGIMTFKVNHDGVVYQKDLGEDTEKTAQAMTIFNPDSTWGKVKH